MERSGRCILVCAGDFTPVDLGVTNDDFLIAVDAGLEHLLRIDTLPDHLVGDFDSLDESYRELVDRMEEAHPESVTRLNPVKDDTDAMAAVMIGMERGYRRFYIYGGMGGRLDHTLGNLQLLTYLRERGCKGYLMDEKTMVTVIRGETIRFHETFDGTVSLVALSDAVPDVTIRGMKYETEHVTLVNGTTLGISNEKRSGAPAEITVGNGYAAVIASWAPTVQ
ncbi:MAG: thiamine diphosphokinase [Lachnospiraceae bacterium]|nr:thiamine diphosphokinase [Lachnospiraceae bacterium]